MTTWFGLVTLLFIADMCRKNYLKFTLTISVMILIIVIIGGNKQ